MKIIATSDLHGDLPEPSLMPPGDVLVLAGDLLPDDYRFKYRSEIGTSRTERQGWWFESVFIPWLHSVKHLNPDPNVQVWEKRYKHVVIVGGNHDFFLQAMLPSGIQKMLPKHVTYLSESSEIIDGVKFFGAGWNMTKGWAFALEEPQFLDKLRYAPNDIDVMIVHGPPYLNEVDKLAVHFCSPYLRHWVHQHPSIKAFICGHIHEAFGEYKVGNTPVYVVSRKDRNYKDVHPFVEINIESKTEG